MACTAVQAVQADRYRMKKAPAPWIGARVLLGFGCVPATETAGQSAGRSPGQKSVLFPFSPLVAGPGQEFSVLVLSHLFPAFLYDTTQQITSVSVNIFR
jgi:hypothetical protein